MKKMKVMLMLFSFALMGFAVPAYALFNNGGFEAGDFSGWTLQYGNVTANTASPVWGVTPYGIVTPQVVTSANTYPGQTIDIDPYNGFNMAKINDVVGSYHATRISQAAALAAADIGQTLYVNWGVVLEDPNHGTIDQPYFSIKVLKNGVLVDSFSANATNASTAAGWLVAGSYNSPLWYKAGQYTYNLAGLAGWGIGDEVTIDMFVTDCGQGGHGGYAFLDGIGTEYVPPPNGVPEPLTMLLLGSGLVGIIGFGRKFKR